ncbi:MAG TPA: dihydroorotase [Bacteroidia bacterium]|nr:dihydroorotase [Bacteroidia bacterium]
MKYTLIKNAKIIDNKSKYHLKNVDLLIDSGIIKKIDNSIEPILNETEIIEGNDLHVSIGWMDLRVNFNDPGNEYKEDIQSGSLAAIHGGFTAVACMGTTNPALHSKSQIEYIVNKSKATAINIYPIGTVSNKAEGIDLAELYDMSISGAIAFSDNKNPIANAELLQRAMLYASGFNKKIIQIPLDKKIANEGKMNEGKVSTTLGLKGIPALAEELMLQRDLMLAEHHRLAIHIGGISTAGSVALIRNAKKNGVKVTCDVHAINLLFSDEELSDFDTNFKILPPLRTQHDINALIEGILDDTIDVICSDHCPQDTESKVKEFDIAEFGVTGLETFYSVLIKAIGEKVNVEKLIEKIAVNPRQLFNIDTPVITENSKVDLTIFSPTQTWKYESDKGYSKSKNSPLDGQTLKGKVIKAMLKK